MVNHRVARIPVSFLVSALAPVVAGCSEERSSAPTLITIDSDQVTWESTEGALRGIVDVLERDGMIWVLSPVEPFVYGLRYGAEMVAFGTQGDGPGEFRSATAHSEVTLPPAFQLFRVSDSHFLGVVTDDMGLQRVASIPFPQSLRPFVRDGSRPVSATAPEMRLAFGTTPDDSGSGRLSLFQYGDEPERGGVREVRPEPGAGGS